MDAKQVALEQELSELLQRASEVASRLQKLEQGRGTPHYDEIESAAHEVGQRLSRMVQHTRAGDIAIEHPREAACPDCRRRCPVETVTRQVTSTDGPVDITETIACCTCCRRSFFPSTPSAGAGSAGIDSGVQATTRGAQCGTAITETRGAGRAAGARSAGVDQHDRTHLSRRGGRRAGSRTT